MSTENAAENAVENSDEMDAAFDAGFTKTPIDLTETPAVEPVAPAPEVKYAQVTEEQLNNLLERSAAFDSHQANTKKELDRAFGTIGNMKQVIDRLQAGTQAGTQVELTAEDVKEITEQYPDLGASMLKTLQSVVGKLKGTGTAAAPFDLTSIDQRVSSQVQPALEQMTVKIRNEIAAEELSESYPNWREIAGAKDSNTEFRQWLAKQPDNRAEKVLGSSRASVIQKALDDFTKSKKVAPAKPNKREEILRASITPSSEANISGSAPVEDDFEAGFKSVKKY